MNMITHILKKDIHRLRVFLGFWLLITLLASAAIVITPSASNFAMKAILELVTILVRVLQMFMMALIVPFLMHDEPTVGTEAFWLTRPVERMDVLKAKILFAGTFFVVIPVLCNTLVLAANGVPFGYLFPILLGDLINYSAALMLLMSMASMTRNFAGYALVGGVYLILGIVVGVIIVALLQFNPGNSVSIALTDSRGLLGNMAGLVVLSGLVIHQFRSRRLTRAYILLAFVFILTLWIETSFPWSFFPSPKGTLTDAQAARIEANIDFSMHTYVHDSHSIKKTDIPKKEIAGDFLYDGLPDHAFARPRRIEASFEVDGKSYGDAVAQSTLQQSRFITTQALQSLVEPAYLIMPRTSTGQSNTQLKLPASEYNEIKNREGNYKAELELHIFQYKEAGRLSLQPDAVHANDRTRVTVAAVLNETEGCIVIVREQYINPLLHRNREPMLRPRFHYVLLNRETDEAFLPENDFNGQFSLRENAEVGLQNKSLHFTSVDKTANTIDEAWLADAELLIIQTEWLGKTEKRVTQQGFRMPDTSPGFNMVQGQTADDNIEKLAEIEPLDNPTRDEVRTYILKINAVSSTQSNFRRKDPQIAMLTDVGHENLDLLLRCSTGNSYYIREAVKNLATADDRDLILSELARQTALAELVVKFQWQEDARPILLRGLQREEYLPGDWIKAVALLDDPTTYPLLIRFLARGKNPATTYGYIKNLPGIELDDAVSKAWKKSKNDFEYRRIGMSSIALGYGIEDALKSAMKDLDDPGKVESHHLKKKLRSSIKRHTGLNGSDDELIAWYAANKERLRFNPETKIYDIAD